MERKPLTIEELLALPPFRTLSDSDMQLLFETTETLYLNAGDTIFNKDDDARGILLITNGRAKLMQTDAAGHSMIVRIVGDGDFFGYSALFPDKDYPTSAEVVEDCRLLRIDKETALHIIHNNIDACIFCIHELANQLTFSRRSCLSLTHKQLRERIAYTLLRMKHEHGVTTNGQLNVLLSREEIGKLSNMTTSNAIRTLSDLQQEKIIKIDGRQITILDEEKLEHLALIG